MVNGVVTQGVSSSLEPSRLSTGVAEVNRRGAATPAPGSQDRVVLSAAARAASAAVQAASSSVAAESPQPPTSTPVEPLALSRAEQRAAALVGALDADQDGTLSKEEFVEGAVSLLRRAHGHRHGDGHSRTRDARHDDSARADGHHRGRGLRRLERRLDRAFNRIDADGSGTVDKSELTVLLDRVAPGRAANPQPSVTSTGPDPTPAPAPQTPPSTTPGAQPVPQTVAAPAGSAFSFTVTVTTTMTYSVAVQRYQEAAQTPL